MLQNPRKTTVEINLHGLTTADAKRKLEQFLSRLPASVTEVIVIHGYHGGQALGNMVPPASKTPTHPRKDPLPEPRGNPAAALSPGASPFQISRRSIFLRQRLIGRLQAAERIAHDLPQALPAPF